MGAGGPPDPRTAFPGVYAVGDVTSVGTPKAGVFAEGQASVVAEHIGAILGGDGELPLYDGRGVCYLAFGADLVARVEVVFMAGRAPDGVFEGPSRALSGEKGEFGTSRIRRWFDRTWSAEEHPVP